MPRRIAAVLASVVVLFHVVAAGQTRPPGDDLQVARQALAPTGVLRAAFLRDNPVQGRVNPQTGEVTGLAADVIQRLATILGMGYQLIQSENAAAVIMNVNTGAADFGFLAYDAERTEQVDYAGNLAVMRSSYVVADASPLRRSSDADRKGVVIGAVKGASQQLFLSSTLRQASLRAFDTQPARDVIERLLATGELSAFAMNRQRALDLDAASSALRALPDSFVDIPQSFVVRKGDGAKRARLQRIAAEMRASGVVIASIRKAGLEDSTAVAPEDGNLSAPQDPARARTTPTPASREALAELNARFTVRGRPVHPGLIERFERWESDAAEPAVVSVDALAAAGSNEFSDDSVKREDDGQVTIMKEAGRGFFGYKWLGSVAPGMHVVRAFANGGGSGIFETLFVLRASAGTGQGPDGPYPQLLISVVRVFPLGDRDEASVTVRPNTILISKSRYRDKAVTLQIK